SLPTKDNGRGASPPWPQWLGRAASSDVCLRCATQRHRAWPRRAQARACSPRSQKKTRERAMPYLVRWAASCCSPRKQQLKTYSDAASVKQFTHLNEQFLDDRAPGGVPSGPAKKETPLRAGLRIRGFQLQWPCASLVWPFYDRLRAALCLSG